MSGHAIVIEDFDLTPTHTSPSVRLSTWMPGRRLKAINASDRSKLVTSAISSLLDRESSAEAAANELRQMYPSDRESDVVPAAIRVNIDPKTAFIMHKSAKYHLPAPNPIIYQRMLNMPREIFLKVHKDFFMNCTLKE